MSVLIPKRHFIASAIVCILKKKERKKYFIAVFFFNLSARTNSGEFKSLGKMMRRGGRTDTENRSLMCSKSNACEIIILILNYPLSVSRYCI